MMTLINNNGADDAAATTYACSQCDKIFSTQAALNAHRSAHVGKPKGKCCFCGQAYYSERIAAHEQQCAHNPQRTSFEFACDQCTESFATARGRSTHRARAHAVLSTSPKAIENRERRQRLRKKTQATSTLTIGEQITRDDLFAVLAALLPDKIALDDAPRAVECVDAMFDFITHVQAKQ